MERGGQLELHECSSLSYLGIVFSLQLSSPKRSTTGWKILENLNYIL